VARLSRRAARPALSTYRAPRDGGAGCTHGERLRHLRPEPHPPGPLDEADRRVRPGLRGRPRPRLDGPVPPRRAPDRRVRDPVRGRVLRVRDGGGGDVAADGREDDRGGRGPPRGGRSPPAVLGPDPRDDRRAVLPDPRARPPAAGAPVSARGGSPRGLNSPPRMLARVAPCSS